MKNQKAHTNQTEFSNTPLIIRDEHPRKLF